MKTTARSSLRSVYTSVRKGIAFELTICNLFGPATSDVEALDLISSWGRFSGLRGAIFRRDGPRTASS